MSIFHSQNLFGVNRVHFSIVFFVALLLVHKMIRCSSVILYMTLNSLQFIYFWNWHSFNHVNRSLSVKALYPQIFYFLCSILLCNRKNNIQTYFPKLGVISSGFGLQFWPKGSGDCIWFFKCIRHQWNVILFYTPWVKAITGNLI